MDNEIKIALLEERIKNLQRDFDNSKKLEERIRFLEQQTEHLELIKRLFYGIIWLVVTVVLIAMLSLVFQGTSKNESKTIPAVIGYVVRRKRNNRLDSGHADVEIDPIRLAEHEIQYGYLSFFSGPNTYS